MPISSAINSWIIFVCGFSLASVSFAQSFCEVALTSRAFNTSDFAQTSSLLVRKKNDVCSSEYSSATEAVSAAQQSGGNVGYGGLSVGLSDARQTASGKFSLKDSKFCSASSEEIDALTSLRAKTQVADTALAAWSKCISDSTNSNLYVQFKLKEDGTGMAGTIFRSLRSGAVGEIRGIATSETEAVAKEISCRIGTRSIRPDTSVIIPIDRAETSIACTKPASRAVAVALVTSVGDPDWIHIPSATGQRQARLEALNDSLNALKREIASLTTKMARVEASPTTLEVRSEVDTKVNGLNQRISTSEVTLNQRIADADSRIRWKYGNNCTATCFDYCAGSQWENYSGECLLSVIGGGATRKYKSCDWKEQNPQPGCAVHCLCSKR